MSGSPVLTVNDVCASKLEILLGRYGLSLSLAAAGADIEASFWGGREAGIAGMTVYARPDTPVHSVLHEACHVVCMDATRRLGLNRDAGGDDLEEAAVCYLQVLLADCLEDVGAARLMQDMDSWGYSFRLGSTRRWFAEDADDARAWLVREGILTEALRPSFACRQ